MRRTARGRVPIAIALTLVGGCTLPQPKVDPSPPTLSHAAPGGVVTVGITAPAGVDPLLYHEPAAQLVGSVLCETLVTVDPETGHLKPGLALKWTVTEGGARIIFQLRKDAYFHDGRPVRSADVAASLRRLANPEHASYVANLMGGVLGLSTFRADVDEGLPDPLLTGVRVIEPFSFEIFLRPRRPDFLRALAHPAMAPVSKSPYDIDPKSAPNNPQCAGPYRLDAPYSPGAKEIVLKRFDRYFGASSAFALGGKGFADEIRFRVYRDENDAFQAYERGEVDLAGVPSAAAAEARKRFGARAAAADLPQEEFIGLPHGAEAGFGDRNKRIALSQALDRERLVTEVYGDAHKPASGFIPPALIPEPPPRTGKGSVRKVEYGCGDTVPLASDPDAARRSWAAAADESSTAPATGSPTAPVGPPTTGSAPVTTVPTLDAEAGAPATTAMKLYFNDEPVQRRLAEAVAAQWRDVLGIEVVPTPLNWDEYLQKGTVGTGFDGPFRLSYSPLYGSPEPFLGGLFIGRNRNAANFGGYNSPAFDAALENDTRPETDDQERLLRYRELEDLLCNDMAAIPIAFGQRTFVFSDRVVAARTSGRLLTRDAVPLLRDLAVVR